MYINLWELFFFFGGGGEHPQIVIFCKFLKILMVSDKTIHYLPKLYIGYSTRMQNIVGVLKSNKLIAT